MKCKYFLCSCLFLLLLMLTSISFGACNHTSLSSWRSDNSYHWKICNDCGEKVNKKSHSMKWKSLNSEKHYQKCSTCSRSTSSSAHSFSKATCTKPQTCKCGATKGSKLGHDKSSAWSSDSSRHYHVCSRCKGQFDSASHSSTWVYNSEKHYKQCSKCGYKSSVGNHNLGSDGVCTSKCRL